MTPSPEPVAPERPRIPDWVFAVGLVVSILILLLAPGWTPDTASFLEPREVSDADPVVPESVAVGEYLPLAEVRPEEEVPAEATIAVEEFGYDVSVDGTSFTWGASVRNTHGEFAADFGLQVMIDGAYLEEYGEDSSASSTLTLPGGVVQAGGSFYMGDDFPSEPVVEVEAVRLEWFAFHGEPVIEPQSSPLSTRLDGVDEGDGGKMRFAVTITNSAAYAVDPTLSAVFRRTNGALVGGADLFLISVVPPGDSTRELWVWKEDVPAGADLSLTEFVPTW